VIGDITANALSVTIARGVLIRSGEVFAMLGSRERRRGVVVGVPISVAIIEIITLVAITITAMMEQQQHEE
jgi:hypothetical protein